MPTTPLAMGGSDAMLAVNAVPGIPVAAGDTADPPTALAETVDALETVLEDAVADAFEEFEEVENVIDARLSRFERFTASMGAWTCGLLARIQPPAGPFFVSDGRLINFDDVINRLAGDAAPSDDMTPTHNHYVWVIGGAWLRRSCYTLAYRSRTAR
ncbi:MAG: hypothetical protein ABI068_17855 [Ktedonobacterales bacterium]